LTFVGSRMWRQVLEIHRTELHDRVVPLPRDAAVATTRPSG